MDRLRITRGLPPARLRLAALRLMGCVKERNMNWLAPGNGLSAVPAARETLGENGGCLFSGVACGYYPA